MYRNPFVIPLLNLCLENSSSIQRDLRSISSRSHGSSQQRLLVRFINIGDNFEDKRANKSNFQRFSPSVKFGSPLHPPDPNRPLDEYVRLKGGGILLEVDASIVISEFVPWNITWEDVLGILWTWSPKNFQKTAHECKLKRLPPSSLFPSLVIRAAVQTGRSKVDKPRARGLNNERAVNKRPLAFSSRSFSSLLPFLARIGAHKGTAKSRAKRGRSPKLAPNFIQAIFFHNFPSISFFASFGFHESYDSIQCTAPLLLPELKTRPKNFLERGPLADSLISRAARIARRNSRVFCSPPCFPSIAYAISPGIGR